MNLRLRIEHLLKESGPAPDNPRLLAFLLDNPEWMKIAFRFFRLKFTPLLLTRIRQLDAPLEERSRLFTQAISFINAGETYKTTGAYRTKLVDAAIVRHAKRFKDVNLVEVGASDGVASLQLMDTMPNMRQLTLTDRHPSFYRHGTFPVVRILNGERRILGIKILGLYINLSLEQIDPPSEIATISTLNPLLEKKYGVTEILPFDVRNDRLPEQVEVIKCANLFNCKYFPDHTIKEAAANLGQSLIDGGLLFISQNNECYADGESYFVLEKRAGTLSIVESKNEHEAVHLFR